MSGAPREAYAGRNFVVINLDSVEALASWEAAGVFQRIAWRCEQDGHWIATVAEIAAEVRLSEHKTKRALAEVRDAGWITSERADRWSPVQRWSVVWGSASREGENPPHVEGDTDLTVTGKIHSTPSSKKKRSKTTAPDAGGEPQVLALVASGDTSQAALFASDVVEKPEHGEVRQPNGGDLFAAWVDGFREAHGRNPDPAAFGRLKGQIREIKASRTDTESWRTAWQAFKAAGRRGDTNVLRELLGTTYQPQSSGRANPYAVIEAQYLNGEIDDNLNPIRPAVGGVQ